MEITDRFEFKFLLTSIQYEAIFSAFGNALQPDTQGGPAGIYPVVSLYFDTPDLTCFWDAWRRLPSRRKLRIRVYGSADGAIPHTSFVEVKCKIDGSGIKHRVQTSLINALALASGKGSVEDFTTPTNQVVDLVHQMLEVEKFQPSCMLRYTRHAYTLHKIPGCNEPLEEPLRITFDEQIRYRFDNLVPEPEDSRFTLALIPDDQRILEIKGLGTVPFVLSQFLGEHKITPVSLSKYCTAMGLKLKP